MKLTELYEKFINIDYKKRLLILVVIALLIRLIFIHTLDMEIDTYYYACLTQDIRTAVVTGKIFTSPINHEHYRGIEYRSPLFSLLAALISLFIGNIEASLIGVSLIAGCILVIPVFLLARRLWGDPAGELASLILLFSPHSVLYSITGRSESLYTLMFTFAVYFVVLAYEQNKWKDFILSGIFWGLAYQTRFEALAAVFTTMFLFFFGFIDKRFKKNNIEYLKKIGAFLLIFSLVVLPYVVIIYKTSGEFSITSPSKKILDMKESLWIITAQPGKYSSFNYFYGAPGEYDYKTLKQLIPETLDQLITENAGKIIPAVIRNIPINIRMILVNFNFLILLFLLIPFVVKWKLRDPRVAILWLYFLTAIPIVLLSYWDSDPRYYSFFIPLAAINVGGIVKYLWEGKISSPLENDKLKSIFTWVLIPAALLLSWYFYNSNPLAPGWLEINARSLIITLHKSLIILMIIFAGTGILTISLSIIWKRVFPFITVPAAGLGIMVLMAGFLEPARTEPIQISVFLTHHAYAPVRSLIIWLFTAGLLYEAILFAYNRFKKIPDLNRTLITVSLVFLILINIHNIIVVNKELEVFRYLNYNYEAVKAIKNKGSNNLSVMCRHPRDAFILGARWLKIPPETDFKKFRDLLEKDKPDFVITDSKTTAGTGFRPLYPIFLIMREKGELTELKFYEKNNLNLNENLIRVWVYQRADAGGQMPDTRSIGATFSRDPHKNQKVEIGQKPEIGNLLPPPIPGFNGIPGRPVFNNNNTDMLPLTDSSSLFRPKALKNIVPPSHPWGKFHNDLRNTGRSPYKGPDKGAEVVWKFKTGHEIFSSPVISKNGHIIFGCDDSHIYAVNFKGRQVWKYKTDYYASASPGLSSNGTVYVGSDDQHLYSLSPKGKLNWRFKTGYYISSGAVVAGGAIIICGEDGFVYWLDKKGKLIRKYKTGGEIIGTPAVYENTLYVTCQDGNLYYISMKGQLIRKFKAGGELISSPAVGDDGTIYFGSDDHNLYAVTDKGKLKWKYRTGGAVVSSPAVAHDGKIIFGSKDGYLYALSPEGKLLWKFETGFSVESSPAVDVEGRIYFGSHDRHIYGISPKGKLLWKVKTGGAVYSSPAIGPDGTVYAGSMDKYLYAVRKSSVKRQ